MACVSLCVSTIDIVYNDCHQISLEVSSRLGVSPFVLVTSDIPVGLGEMEYDNDENFHEDNMRIPVGLGENDDDYVL